MDSQIKLPPHYKFWTIVSYILSGLCFLGASYFYFVQSNVQVALDFLIGAITFPSIARASAASYALPPEMRRELQKKYWNKYSWFIVAFIPIAVIATLFFLLVAYVGYTQTFS